jgi:predicted RNA-binding Zn ribbon-like protein
MTYRGPLRDEPVAIELHNTVYAAGGELRDGLADAASAAAFVRAIAPRLAADGLPGGTGPAAAELAALRAAVRAALGAAVAGEPPERDALDAINAAAARAAVSPRAIVRGGRVVRSVDRHGAGRADVVLAAFAADAIDLLTGPLRGEIRACGAPGCVLLYVRDHPRRQWCSNACGNRARQARHYRRTHAAPAAPDDPSG